MEKLSTRDRRFADALVNNAGNASAAAREIGMSPSRGRELRQKPTIKKYVESKLAEMQSYDQSGLSLSRELVEKKTLELYDAAIKKGSLVAAASSLTIAERLTKSDTRTDSREKTWEDLIIEANKEIESLSPDEKLEFVARSALFDLGVTEVGSIAPSARLLGYLRKRLG